MPRVTRNRKAAIITSQADIDIASKVALPDTPVKTRAPLGEIHNRDSGVGSFTDKTTTQSGKTSIAAQGVENQGNTIYSEIAIESKKTKKRKAKKQKKANQLVSVDDVIIDAAGPISGDTPGIQESAEVQEELNQIPSNVLATVSTTDQELPRESFIEMKSPGKSLDEIETACEAENAKLAVDKDEDSFVDHIIARSPAKPVPRIEDSVEALDKLEDALDTLDEIALAQKTISRKTVTGGPGTNGKATTSKKHVKRPSSLLPPKQPIKSIKPVTRSNFELPGEAVARKLKEQREAREARRQSTLGLQTTNKDRHSSHGSSVNTANTAVPKIKSTKPPTKSTFALPGEAIAKKLKEQREAREAKRQSMVAPPGPSKERREFQPPRTVAPAAPRVKSTKPPTKAHFELPGEALSRKKREQQEARRKQIEEEEERRRVESKSKPLRLMVDENDRMRKEREAAAKKAREEAAERGRLASKAWAEKHRDNATKKVVAGQ